MPVKSMFSPFGFYLDISAWHLHKNSSGRDATKEKAYCPHSRGPGFKSTRCSKVDSAFHPSEADQMSTKNLVVKSKRTPDSGSATLRQFNSTQPAITYSKLTIETLEQGVKYVQS